MSTHTHALRCQDLVKRFAETTAVDHLDLTVPAGSVFGLLGPNGSGKTSTIRTLLGIYVPDGGSVEVLGSPDPMAVRHRVGYLPEERGLYAKMKVLDQLAFLASIRGLDQKASTTRARAWLERVGLADNAESLTSELSKGMQQKVQFASAVIHEPDLIVLDEPFTGLDPVNSRLLKELILEQRARGATVVLSTHRMEQVEALCESICLIHHGRPVLSGVLADIKAGYGRNTIALEYRGASGSLTGVAGVRRYEDTGQEARLELEPETDAQMVIRTLLDRVEVQAVRLEQPHLEEIYLEKVGYQVTAQDTPAEATS
jgi:ABC-2 type transport system ATP-binding protein